MRAYEINVTDDNILLFFPFIYSWKVSVKAKHKGE